MRDDLGADDGVVILDETGVVKKGRDAVGVARQYCGPLGTVANGQMSTAWTAQVVHAIYSAYVKLAHKHCARIDMTASALGPDK